MLKKVDKRLFMFRSLKRFGFDKMSARLFMSNRLLSMLMRCGTQGFSINRLVIQSVFRDGHICTTILGRQFTSIKQCNLDRLSERIEDHCLKFARGLVDNPRTSYLLPATRISSFGRNLRNEKKISQPRIKTNRFKQSPIPDFVSLLHYQ